MLPFCLLLGLILVSRGGLVLFVVRLQGRDALYAAHVAEQLRGRLCHGGISASIGVAFPQSAAPRLRDALRKDAEQALRQAKRAGKCRVMVWASPSPAAPAWREAVPAPIEQESKAPSALKAPTTSPTSAGGVR